MMMMPKKASATVIVSKMLGHKKGEGDDYSMEDAIDRGHEGEEGDEDMMRESIMEEFISALGSKDAKAAAEALKHFVYLCDDDEGPEAEELPED